MCSSDLSGFSFFIRLDNFDIINGEVVYFETIRVFASVFQFKIPSEKGKVGSSYQVSIQINTAQLIRRDECQPIKFILNRDCLYFGAAEFHEIILVRILMQVEGFFKLQFFSTRNNAESKLSFQLDFRQRFLREGNVFHCGENEFQRSCEFGRVEVKIEFGIQWDFRKKTNRAFPHGGKIHNAIAPLGSGGDFQF